MYILWSHFSLTSLTQGLKKTCSFNLQGSLALKYFRISSSMLLVNWLVGVSLHGCKQWYQNLPRKKCVLTGCFVFFPPLHFPISFQLAAILPNASSSSASSAASAVPAAPPFAPKRTSSVPGARAPAGPAAPSAPHPPSHDAPLSATAAADGAATTNDELPATQLPPASPAAAPAVQKHPH